MNDFIDIDKKIKDQHSDLENPPEHYWNDLQPLLPERKVKFIGVVTSFYFKIAIVLMAFTIGFWQFFNRSNNYQQGENIPVQNEENRRRPVRKNVLPGHGNTTNLSEDPSSEKLVLMKRQNPASMESNITQVHSARYSFSNSFGTPIDCPGKKVESIGNENKFSVEHFIRSEISAPDPEILASLPEPQKNSETKDYLRQPGKFKNLASDQTYRSGISAGIGAIYQIRENSSAPINGFQIHLKYKLPVNGRPSYFLGVTTLFYHKPGLVRNSYYHHYFLDHTQIYQKLTIRDMLYAGPFIGIDVPFNRYSFGLQTSQMYLIFATSDLTTERSLPGDNLFTTKDKSLKTYSDGLHRFQPVLTAKASYRISPSLSAGLSLSRSFNQVAEKEVFSDIPFRQLFFIGLNMDYYFRERE